MQLPARDRDEPRMIADILSGDHELFHELIRPHERSVYLMALSLLHNEAEAEDAAQDAFLKAYRNLGRFRAEARFSTWLISIVLNEARGRLRRIQPGLTDSLDDDREGKVTPMQLTDWREIPSQALERQEVRSLIRQALMALPLAYREVFVLREMEDRNVQETAETLGITVASVKMRLHRARLMLQKSLAPQLKSAVPETRRSFSWF
ncbi:RNA polymerase sigma-70 factor (ECF subfamily) [Edaphobacter aggregans]|uniref:RNA polymerase sigma-70 factor (ECF subfamily) n=2 Tax=Edaphobacter aggregans TaxID=570835 RepID=A0A428MGA8_9BACT|nr:RNA polymerase sigma-70 factor (ECF subfamily) [Edaphobacter aggregans]